MPALEPTLAARSTCATKDVTRWFSRWWSGLIVSTPTPQGCCGSLYAVYIQKPSVLWRSPLLLQINERRPDSCGVSDGLPPTPLASSRHNRHLSDNILFHRSSVVSRYRLLWRNRCRPVSHGPPPLLYQPVLVKYPYVEPELTAEVHRHPKMAAAKTEDL